MNQKNINHMSELNTFTLHLVEYNVFKTVLDREKLSMETVQSELN